MKAKKIINILWLTILLGCKQEQVEINAPANDNPSITLTKLAFSSCGNQNLEQPILYTIANYQPDVFCYVGDNVYGDTRNMSVLRQQYAKLASKPEFAKLTAETPIIATWDDHDYGENDAGTFYPMKNFSKDIFLNFWGEPASSPRRSRDGIYTSYYYGDQEHRVQIILLDNRYNRSNLDGSLIGYTPSNDPTRTMLGENQWNWLKNELLQPAKIRIIASSTQFCVEHNGWEAWANFPLQQEKMFETIREAHAEGVFFLSGDVHYGELSKQTPEDLYPIYDLTSSGITNIEDNPAPNQYRIVTKDPIMIRHFGAIEINWDVNPVTITYKIIGGQGNTRLEHTIDLDELKF
ncbi:MAG: alkaline phosphatase family protein [Chitinophagales bacterium]|nr:alkaline phosphatase family protein [Chitinophagales bacterium]